MEEIVVVKESKMEVVVLGERSTFISGNLLKTVKEKYTYQFTSDGQRVFWSGVAREELKRV